MTAVNVKSQGRFDEPVTQEALTAALAEGTVRGGVTRLACSGRWRK